MDLSWWLPLSIGFYYCRSSVWRAECLENICTPGLCACISLLWICEDGVKSWNSRTRLIQSAFSYLLASDFSAFDWNQLTWRERLIQIFHWITLDFRFSLIRTGLCSNIFWIYTFIIFPFSSGRHEGGDRFKAFHTFLCLYVVGWFLNCAALFLLNKNFITIMLDGFISILKSYICYWNSDLCRYEVCICIDKFIESVSSGPLEPLLLHSPKIRALQEKGCYATYQLVAPDDLDAASRWFTKSTLVRCILANISFFMIPER